MISEGFHGLLVPQEVGVVGADRLPDPEEREDDGEAHRGLGGGHGDDEEGEDLARPCVVRVSMRLNATRVRFTAFSISSMLISSTRRLRRRRKPTVPMAKRTAATTRKYSRGTRGHECASLAAATAGVARTGFGRGRPRAPDRELQRGIGLLAARDRDGADHRDQQQRAADLEGHEVGGEELVADAFDRCRAPGCGAGHRREAAAAQAAGR